MMSACKRSAAEFTTCLKMTALVLVLGLMAAKSFVPAVHAQSCGMNSETVRQRRIDNIKTMLMSQLGGLTSNNASAVVNASALANYYTIRNASLKMEEDERKSKDEPHHFAEIISTLQCDHVSLDNVTVNSKDNIVSQLEINFDVAPTEAIKHISKAELVLYQLEASTTAAADTDEESMEHYVEVRALNRSTGVSAIEVGKYTDVRDSGYQVFDITHMLKKWASHHQFSTGSEQITFQVVIYSFTTSNPVVMQFLSDCDDVEKSPKIMIVSKNPLEFQERHSKRSRKPRSVGGCSGGSIQCCREELTLSFHDDLEMHDIVHPETLQVNFCDGLCPSTKTGSLATAAVYEDIYSLVPSHGIEPCCVPDSFSNLDVLKTDGFTYTLVDVIVNTCRCA